MNLARWSTVAAVLAIALLAAAPASAAGGASVRGGGSGLLPDFFGQLAGDRLHVELVAHTSASGGTTGRFHLAHQRHDGGIAAELSGTVTCMVSADGQASVTGTITSGHLAEAPGFDPAGQVVAITVVDRGQEDEVGVDLSFFGTPHAIAPCEPVFPYLAIDEGNFTTAV
jgi:hypothetical protein